MLIGQTWGLGEKSQGQFQGYLLKGAIIKGDDEDSYIYATVLIGNCSQIFDLSSH